MTLGSGPIRFQRPIDVGADLRVCPPNGQPHRVAPTNFGETEPLPNFALVIRMKWGAHD